MPIGHTAKQLESALARRIFLRCQRSPRESEEDSNINFRCGSSCKTTSAAASVIAKRVAAGERCLRVVGIGKSGAEHRSGLEARPGRSNAIRWSPARENHSQKPLRSKAHHAISRSGPHLSSFSAWSAAAEGIKGASLGPAVRPTPNTAIVSKHARKTHPEEEQDGKTLPGGLFYARSTRARFDGCAKASEGGPGSIAPHARSPRARTHGDQRDAHQDDQHRGCA
ncbi:hypothetical protein pipiens_014939 [Culex pipiens pipiens]|uniref:Uncharacterized protein n=1 Tax=Culex pipiens pipiens TaxID=38569 RepID=A0ABD1CSK4_CULPP